MRIFSLLILILFISPGAIGKESSLRIEDQQPFTAMTELMDGYENNGSSSFYWRL